MPPKRPNKNNQRTSPATGLTRGDAPMERRPRPYPSRNAKPSRGAPRGTTRGNQGYNQKRNAPNRASSTRQLSRELDEKLVELQALFDLSKTLNSSLQLKGILDTMLLTPMGKMMIGKGMVLLAKSEKIFQVETLKGLEQANVGKELEIQLIEPVPLVLSDAEDDARASAWGAFLTKLGLNLIVPIMANNRCLGLMAFGNKVSKEDYSNNELEYLNSIANLAASAVENALMFRELKDVNRRLDKKIQELNTLFDIGRELNATLDADKIANVLAYALMGELMVQRCGILVEDGQEFALKVSRGGEKSPVLENAEFHAGLRQLREPLDLRNGDGRLAETWRENLEASGEVLLVPILSQDVVRGAILLGEKITKADFLDDEVEFVRTLGNAAMTSLENARLFKETLEKQKLEEELAIAREIQQRLLPKGTPTLKGYQIAALNIPTQKVGGDSFDYFPIGENRYVISIADVSGKGVPAALLMSNLQATLRAIMSAELKLSDIVGRINNFVYENTTMDKFITFFLGILDLTENSMTYVNAGHNPPYLFHDPQANETKDEFRLLDEGGLLLGMFPNAPYAEETVLLQKGDWIVMFTDGISEALNPEEEEFTEARIEATIRAKLAEGGGTAAAMIDAITLAVKDFVAGSPQSDDITLLTVYYCNSQTS